MPRGESLGPNPKVIPPRTTAPSLGFAGTTGNKGHVISIGLTASFRAACKRLRFGLERPGLEPRPSPCPIRA
jgi:hypothetical protein